MAPSRERSERRREHAPTFVQVCMHCDAVLFVDLPSGWRFWVPAASEAADVLRRGPRGGPRPSPSHGVCRACLRRHYPELLPVLRARFPAARY